MPYFVDPTTQGTEFPRNYYWEGFQGQIVNLSHAEIGNYYWEGSQRQIVNPSRAEANAIFPEPESPQLVDETAEIKEDIRASYSSYFYRNLLSVVDAEIGTNHWQDFQRQIVNPSHAEANAIFPEPESPQLVDETAEIKEDIRASYSSYFYRNLLSVVDAEIGNYYWKNFQGQIVNPGHVKASVIFPEPESPQLIDEMTQIKEDIRSLYLLYASMTRLSDVNTVLTHTETGTAVTDFTQLRKYQAEKQTLEISEQFDILAQRENNWDGRGSQKPTDLTLAHAKEVMGALLGSVISAGYQCGTPSISSDGDGNVTAAWYEDERQLHFQIGEYEAEYFRVWGTNIDTEMDVDFLKPENYLTLWKWLIDGLLFPPDISATLHLSPAMEMAM